MDGNSVGQQLQEYHREILEKVRKAYEIAKKARAKGIDPKKDVEILLASELAGRVESLVSVMVPELLNSGLRERILELEEKYGKGSEKIGFIIAEEVAEGKFVEWNSVERAIEAGLRVGMAYWTLGIVTAPLEGIVGVKLKDRMDGKGKYLAVYLASPIRSAGGTTNALVALLADFLRKKFNLAEYDPTKEEIERYCLEIEDYHKKVQRLQYFPSKEEIRFIVKHLPVEITGDPTEELEVLAYKDLPRVETNRLRGGMIITMSVIALKAKKLLKRVKKYGKEFGLENWMWLKELIELAAGKAGENEKKEKVPPYLSEIPGGRPVFSFPNWKGGFRLRYGRSRNTGFATVGVHPATMGIVEDFMAVGTQLRVEMPGKSAVVMPVDTIEGPIVKLADGSVVKVKSYEEAVRLRHKVKKILFLGDMLVAYGEFLTNGYPLEPSAWVEEWWREWVKSKGYAVEEPETFEEAVKIAKITRVPLHPKYTFFWENLSGEEVLKLRECLKNNEVEKCEQILDKLCVEYRKIDGKIVFEGENEKVLKTLLLEKEVPEDVLERLAKIPGIGAVNVLAPVRIMRKAGRYIGARMGRPEKAERRLLKGQPHVLFPAGKEDRLRNIVAAMKTGIRAELNLRVCPKCGKTTYHRFCPRCGTPTVQRYICPKCGTITSSERHCGVATKPFTVFFVKEDLEKIAKKLNMHVPELLKGVKGLSSETKMPEALEKGFLRAKWDVYVNKDGTVRVDATDAPLTHFKPKEIGVSVEKLRELGYTHDIFGNPLTSDDQILALKPQDVIISDYDEFSLAEYLVRVANFIDELLVKVYGLEPYYNVRKKEDLIGKLVIGLAPHTSAGIIGRIIGFTKARVGFAHPVWHSAKKRNCDGDEDSIMLLLDALLNFSREYLPSTRGGKTMDVPLVLTAILDLLEVDNEVHDMDVVDHYPLEFYFATLRKADPGEIKIKTVIDLYEEGLDKIKYTHETSSISRGPKVTAYRKLETMLDKVRKQLEVGEKLISVDESFVASKILETHFLKDIKGNLRKFTTQVFRCVKCNEKYRRLPLTGKCEKCGGKLIFTVHEGGIKKYYDVALELAEKYGVRKYTASQLLVLKRKIDLLFGKGSKQEGLQKWF